MGRYVGIWTHNGKSHTYILNEGNLNVTGSFTTSAGGSSIGVYNGDGSSTIINKGDISV